MSTALALLAALAGYVALVLLIAWCAGFNDREQERTTKCWSRAVSQLEAAKSAMIKAECELSNATNALGKWLMPDDAKEGEVFCVWHGDSLIQAENKGNSRYAISVRKRGRSLT